MTYLNYKNLLLYCAKSSRPKLHDLLPLLLREIPPAAINFLCDISSRREPGKMLIELGYKECKMKRPTFYKYITILLKKEYIYRVDDKYGINPVKFPCFSQRELNTFSERYVPKLNGIKSI